jgi:hypothetical protein
MIKFVIAGLISIGILISASEARSASCAINVGVYKIN